MKKKHKIFLKTVAEPRGSYTMNLERWYRPKGGAVRKQPFYLENIQLERVIGRGRSGTVFLARHLGLDEERAIKRVRRTESGFHSGSSAF